MTRPVLTWKTYTATVKATSRLRALAHTDSLVVDDLAVLGAPAEATAEGLRQVEYDLPDLSEFETPLDKARVLLGSAAAVEHALLVQYLYAAYSLKPSAASGLTPEQGRAVAAWRETIRQIAIEEMGHLMTVQNLLLFLGQTPEFGRVAPDEHLSPFPTHLKPLTQRSLATYVVAESPVEGASIDDIVDLATGKAGKPVRHVGVLYALLELVFSTPERIPGLPEDDPLHQISAEVYRKQGGPGAWHLPDTAFDPSSEVRQAKGTEWGGGNVHVDVVKDRASALAAIETIAVQGEGRSKLDQNDPSHFERFRDIYRGVGGLPPFPDANGWKPTLDVPVDPRLPQAGDPPQAGDITHPQTRLWAELADVRYALLLGILEHVCRATHDHDRLLLRGWAWAEMGYLGALQRSLVSRPRAQTGTGVAALPFSLPALRPEDEDDHARWQAQRDLCQRAVQQIDAIREAAAAGPDGGLLTRMRASDVARLGDIDHRLQHGPELTNSRHVRAILEAAVRTQRPPHGRFWNLPLADFIADPTAGIVVGQGALSTMANVLRSHHMPPSPLPPVSERDIDVIERWIDDGCPE